MARRRMIDPNFWVDEKVAKLSYCARLVFVATWNYADDFGYYEANYDRMRAVLFPYENGKFKISQFLDEIIKIGMIEVYSSESKIYHKIKNFNEYQTISHPTPSKISNFLENSGNFQSPPETSPQVKLSKDKLKEDKLREDKCLEDIISDLNLVLGTSYKLSTPKTKELILSRLKEGFTVDDFKGVHRKMLRAWGADEKMAKYLRPITLYGPKFEGYLNQKEVTTKLTEIGVKAYLVGQDWLSKQVKDVK